jgi:uncharacterized protein YjiS (DUF1127 family)
MKLLKFTIAFVVDGATGSHLTQPVYSTHQFDNNNARVTQKHDSPLRLFQHGFAALSRFAQEMIDDYKESAQRRKAMTELSRLSPHNLRDIGLTHDDLVDLKSRLITLRTLNARPREYQNNFDLQLKKPSISGVKTPHLTVTNKRSYKQSPCD